MKRMPIRALFMNSFMPLTCAGASFLCVWCGIFSQRLCSLIVFLFLFSTKMDPINNCIHMACTEIRAENLSGECDAFREYMAGRAKPFAGHGQVCVKRRAALSLQANPNCRDRVHEYIDAAMERCFEDTFPFDRHPNLR
mmetsp:Transcript_15163/g.34974  ORF Transcript_15163/g.34974 Transcript_15163/m.34974 type:complete len:139 (+) Transcript_15163:430-846(+)